MANWWELPSYEESGSLGYDPESYETGSMLYGLEDLGLFHQGMQELYGTDPDPLYAPEAYDPEKESLLRDLYSEEYQGFQRGIAGLRETTAQNLYSANIKRGKAGFAGGGSAARTAGRLSESYAPSVRSARKGFQTKRLGFEEDIYEKRKGYYEDLWSRYGTYLMQAEHPIGEDWGQTEWDDWTERYMPGPQQSSDCPPGYLWNPVTEDCQEFDPDGPSPFN